MDFSDESYVRLYVRDTKTWLRLGFEGQCCLMFILRKLDKAGVLDGMDELTSDVALVTGVPESIVEIGMPRLLRWEVFQHVGNRLVMPNYLKAQNAIRTDKARQRDLREKRSSEARLVTLRDGAITLRDESSREPTPDNGTSRDVTLYCASLHCADPSCGSPERAPAQGAKSVPKSAVVSNDDVRQNAEPDSSPEVTEVRLVSTEPKPAKALAQSRATRMPEGFAPGAAHRALAHEHGVDLERAFPAFCDHHAAKGSRFLDWSAALRTWIRNEAKFSRGIPQQKAPDPSKPKPKRGEPGFVEPKRGEPGYRDPMFTTEYHERVEREEREAAARRLADTQKRKQAPGRPDPAKTVVDATTGQPEASARGDPKLLQLVKPDVVKQSVGP